MERPTLLPLCEHTRRLGHGGVRGVLPPPSAPGEASGHVLPALRGMRLLLQLVSPAQRWGGGGIFGGAGEWVWLGGVGGHVAECFPAL